MKKLTLAFFLTMLLSIASQAQENTDSTKQKRQRKVELRGRVCDSFTKAAVQKPFITVMNEDSTVVDTITASTWKDWGTRMDRTDYSIKVPAVATKYIIRATAPEYEDTYLNYEIKYVARNAYFEIPMLEMQKRYAYDKELDEVEVVATKVQMVIKGDTIIYNADAFNVPEGSMLDGLIRQMPGVELSDDGVITVNGRKIDRLTLNGDDFMKGNNNAMLQNLPHYTVKDVQVFDKLTDKDEYLGRQTEQKEFVMDVRMKREYNRGYIANAEVGAGTEGRYMARVFGMGYSDKTRVTAFGNMNNVNERRRPGSDGNWDATKEPNGITNIKNAGLDITTKSRDGKGDNSFSADVRWQKDDNESRVAGDNYLNGTSNYSRSNSLSTARNSNFRINNEFKRSDKFHIQNSTNITYGRDNSNSLSRQAMLNEDPAIYGDVIQVLDSLDANVPGLLVTGINKTYNQGYSRNKTLSMNTSSWLIKKLPWGDELIFAANAAYGNNDNKNFSYYKLDYLQGPLPSDYRNNYLSDKGHYYNYSGLALYNFRFLNGLTWNCYYSYSQSYNRSDNPRYRLDFIDGWGVDGSHQLGELPDDDLLLTAIDDNNSVFTGKLTKKNSFQTGLNYLKDKKNIYSFISLGFIFSHVDEALNYTRGTLSTRNNRTYWALNPSFNYYLRHNNSDIISISMSRNTVPSDPITMVAYVDDSNPLAITMGNPDLKNGATDNVHIWIQRTKQKIQQHLSLTLDYTYNENAVIQSYTFDKITGVYTYKPINSNGKYSASAGLEFGRQIDKKGLLKFDASINLNFNHQLQAALTEGNTSAQIFGVNVFRETQRVTLTYKKNDLTLSAGGRLTWAHSSSKLSTFQNSDIYDFNYGVTAQYKLPLSIYIATDLKMNSTRGLTDGSMNTDRLVWNGRLSRSFIKERLTVILEGYDMLHQLKNIRYYTTGNGVSAVWSKSIPSYAMLHLQYKINILPKKK